MDSFSKIQNLISEDKVKIVDDSFSSRLEQRISDTIRFDNISYRIKKIHISYGIAAGLLLGVFIGGVVQNRMKNNNRMSMMENVLQDFYFNDMQIETIDYQMLREL